MTEKKMLYQSIRNHQEKLIRLQTVLDSLPNGLPGTITMSNCMDIWVDIESLDELRAWRHKLGRRLFRKGDVFRHDSGATRYTYNVANMEWSDEALEGEGKYYFPYQVSPEGFVSIEILINVTPFKTCKKVKIGERAIEIFRYDCEEDEERQSITGT